MNELFTEEIKVIHAVKSECLRSITVRYGAYGSILAYAAYKTEFKKSGATKYLKELHNYINQMQSGIDMIERLNDIIMDTYYFIEYSMVKRSWTTYINSIRGLFNEQETNEVILSYDDALLYYEDIKKAVEVRADLLLKQIVQLK